MGRMSRGEGKSRYWIAMLLLAAVIFLPGCHKKTKGGQAAPGQSTFASPDDAARALADGARTDNQQTLLAIFGPNNKDLVDSGDAAGDKTSYASFAAAYDQMHRFRKLDNGNQLLIVGSSNTAFPVPLRQEDSSKWYFDSAAGRDELLARRIGRNELAAIDIMGSLVDAQNEYWAQKHDGVEQFARRFISDADKQNGLYWPQAPGKPRSPVGPLLAYASEQGAQLNSSLHKPFHGYYFGILDTQSLYALGGLKDYVRSGIMNRGFGFIAWPAEYGKSGVMTFIVDRDRVIYQKDLAADTKNVAPFTTQFSPDASWMEVK